MSSALPDPAKRFLYFHCGLNGSGVSPGGVVYTSNCGPVANSNVSGDAAPALMIMVTIATPAGRPSGLCSLDQHGIRGR